MAYHSEITADAIRANLQRRIDEMSAELQALKGVKIDTSHKTLTNRAISGEGARLSDYLGIGKALHVSYSVDHKYTYRDITAYSYYDQSGNEIGTKGYTRISRTITPLELNDILTDVKDGLASAIGDLQSEHRRATSIANKHNALVRKLKEFNDGLSYASQAQI